jgi:hypothetical protein
MKQMSNTSLINNVRVYYEDQMIENGYIKIKNQKIIEIGLSEVSILKKKLTLFFIFLQIIMLFQDLSTFTFMA